jgi:hypothetical protein
MPSFGFRVRFHRSSTDTLNIESSEWEWRVVHPTLILCSPDKKNTIKDSKTLILKSEGWSSEELAIQASAKYVHAFALTLARLRVGADFGSDITKSSFTHAGLAMLAEQTGRRVLNDVHGLMIYECQPPPLFAAFHVDAVRGVSQRQFEEVFSQAIENVREPTAREKLALNLFNASFFQKDTESRFLLLIMAVEALLDPSARSSAATAHVDSMIRATHESTSLSPNEKQSILGSLKWLKRESINQAGRRLAAELLDDRMYMEKKPEVFFSECYSIRSSLVHGQFLFPTNQKVGSLVAHLQIFVSDILTRSVRDKQT